MRQGGMTLIELLIAVFLGLMIMVMVAWIWNQSSGIVNRTTDAMLLHQTMRRALDQMERDLANVAKTVDMELFNDRNQSGHYDSGEALAGLRDTDEFAVDQGIDLNVTAPYIYAPLIYSPTKYPTLERWNDPPGGHWRDEIYFRSYAMVDGDVRPALIHYRLVMAGGSNERPQLVRKVRYLDRSRTEPTVITRTYEIAGDICDLQFEMFYKQSALAGSGRWMNGAQAGMPVAANGSGGIPGLQNQFGNARAVSLYFSGTGALEMSREYGVRFRASTPENFQWGGIRPGTSIYFSNARDDDRITPPPPADQWRNDARLTQLFGQRNFTVAELPSLLPREERAGSQYARVLLQFAEQFDFLSMHDGTLFESPYDYDAFNGTPFAGRAEGRRRVYRSFDVDYRAGFLVPAFRVTIKYRDRRQQRLHTFQRIVRILNP